MHYVLKRFRDRNAEYEDLFQYGCIGLMKAVDRFDPQYSVRFSTYAVPVIMGEVRRYLRDDGPVHVSRTIQENAAKIEKYREAYVNNCQREPTVNEIAENTKLSMEDVLMAVNARTKVRSLNEQVGSEGDMRLMDTLGTNVMDGVEQRMLLAGMLKSLTEAERTVIIRRYFRSNTQTEIARDMGMSQVQISRMESRIIKKLRAGMDGTS